MSFSAPYAALQGGSALLSRLFQANRSSSAPKFRSCRRRCNWSRGTSEPPGVLLLKHLWSISQMHNSGASGGKVVGVRHGVHDWSLPLQRWKSQMELTHTGCQLLQRRRRWNLEQIIPELAFNLTPEHAAKGNGAKSCSWSFYLSKCWLLSLSKSSGLVQTSMSPDPVSCCWWSLPRGQGVEALGVISKFSRRHTSSKISMDWALFISSIWSWEPHQFICRQKYPLEYFCLEWALLSHF